MIQKILKTKVDGLTLIEVVITAALMVLLAVVTTTLLQNQQKNQESIQGSTRMQTLQTLLIRGYNPATCKYDLVNGHAFVSPHPVTIHSGQQSSPSDIHGSSSAIGPISLDQLSLQRGSSTPQTFLKTGVDPTALALAHAAGLAPTLKVRQIILKNITPIQGESNQYTAQIEIQFAEKNTQQVSSNQLPITTSPITLQILFNTVSGQNGETINDCVLLDSCTRTGGTKDDQGCCVIPTGSPPDPVNPHNPNCCASYLNGQWDSQNHCCMMTGHPNQCCEEQTSNGVNGMLYHSASSNAWECCYTVLVQNNTVCCPSDKAYNNNTQCCLDSNGGSGALVSSSDTCCQPPFNGSIPSSNPCSIHALKKQYPSFSAYINQNSMN